MKWDRRQIDQQVKRGMAAAFFVGFLVHQFGLVNVLHNIDDIGQLPKGYGTGLLSGRWFLTVLGDACQAIGGNYNLPYVNGLLYLALVAAAAGLLISIFRIREPLFAVLLGALVAVFPPATSALFFRFTSVYYGISMVLAVLAAWILERYRFGLPLSALCLALSLGLYQGYVPMTIGIFVLLLLQKALQGQTAFKNLVCRGFYYCAALILGLCFYYLLLNLCLSAYGESLNDYNGMDQMGKLALKDLPGLIYESVYTFCMMPLKDYCGLANTALLKGSYLGMAAVTLVLTGYILLAQVKKPLLIAFAGLMCLVFPVAVNFVVIMSPDAWIYTLMLYAFVLVPWVPVVVLDCLLPVQGLWEKGKQACRKLLALLLAVMIFGYGYAANIHYTAVYFSNRQVENYVNALVAQIRMTEGFDTQKEWAFLGEIEDPLLWSAWDYELTYGGSFPTDRTLEAYSRFFWIWHYLGYFPPTATEEKTLALWATDEVKAMPCWPDQGSIRVIGDSVVIKFQNLE